MRSHSRTGWRCLVSLGVALGALSSIPSLCRADGTVMVEGYITESGVPVTETFVMASFDPMCPCMSDFASGSTDASGHYMLTVTGGLCAPGGSCMMTVYTEGEAPSGGSFSHAETRPVVLDGSCDGSASISFDIGPTSAHDGEDPPTSGLPRTLVVGASPNPAPGGTRLVYQLPDARHVRAEILDMQGRLVATLVDENRPAGTSRLTWSGTDARGRALPGGIFTFRVRAGADEAVHKLVLVR